MTELSVLRDTVRSRAGDRCEWPTCPRYGDQLAHLHHRGMGGAPSANRPDNCAWLCVFHHDLLDGRTHTGLKHEMRSMLRWTIQERVRLRLHQDRRTGGPETRTTVD